jgi:hypothetical protein
MEQYLPVDVQCNYHRLARFSFHEQAQLLPLERLDVPVPKCVDVRCE